MLPLIKVPYILVSAASLWVTLTPPHPPPAENEKAESTALEAILKLRSAPLTLKSFGWGVALAEIAVLIARYTPDSSDSRWVLSHLIFPGGAVERIYASPLFFIGAFMTTLGGVIRYRCYRELGSMFTFEMSIRNDHMLVTSGPYGIVRHPGYTGILLVASGMFLMHGSEGSWMRGSGVLNITVMKVFVGLICGLVASILFGLLRRMSKEDEALHQLAREEWEGWAKKVPHKLVPCIY